LVKFGLASAGGVFLGALAVGAGFSAGVVIITVLGVSIGISLFLEFVDSSLGITRSAKDELNALEQYIEDNYTPPQQYRSDVPAWLLR
jgi:hypothetical protein